jgi:hypothetical protein
MVFGLFVWLQVREVHGGFGTDWVEATGSGFGEFGLFGNFGL